MATEKRDAKKNFPNSFLLFLLGSVFLVWVLQALTDTRRANVGFSYQVEHLVNLELIQPEDSRKIALNDNLVTFSGRFRQEETEEGKQRFKYLTFLNNQHELGEEYADLAHSLDDLVLRVEGSSARFLALTGQNVPKSGYVVVDDRRSGANMGPIVVHESATLGIESLRELQAESRQVSSSDAEEVELFGQRVAQLLQGFQSPQLGIGNLEIKRRLQETEALLQGEPGSLQRYTQALSNLQSIAEELGQSHDGVRLGALRSVRTYIDTEKELAQVANTLADNGVALDHTRDTLSHVVWFFNGAELSTKALAKQDPELYHQWYLNAEQEWDNFPENRGLVFRAPDQPRNTVLEKTFKSEEPSPNYISYLIPLLPALLALLVLYFLFSRQVKGAGANAMSFGKSPAKLLNKENATVTFKDVAGIDEAIEELQEIVEFLKNPKKFTSLGGRIPKGVLCIGPPGCGKTLIAKAVAGEAERPFFSISGSDFVEMFVGVGASRIRDMFEQAKKSAPCIIFVDEIDAVGRHRGSGIGGGHDEREQTLNQLLVEMDGFDTNDGVILMAATNRPDVLDKALLRPGRFDRRVIISLPDIKGRYEILKVHARKIKLDRDVDLMEVARGTPGSSGADLENLLNEAALLAASRNRTAVTAVEVREARDKVLYGKERRSLELDEQEKLSTAYHESGHCIVGLVVEHADPVDKVTIIPRGMSLGATMFLPKKNRVTYWQKELRDQLAVLMGGRAAEEIFCEDISSGAQQDFEHATQLARSMVCAWGMSEILGQVAYDERSEAGHYMGMPGYREKKYSEATAQQIDKEVKAILDEAYQAAMRIIQEKRAEVETMVEALLEFETLDRTDVDEILQGTFSEKSKRERMQTESELYKRPKTPPPPPKKASEKKAGPGNSHGEGLAPSTPV